MSITHDRGRNQSAERGRKRDSYWLAWVAAGFAAGSVLPHVMV